MLVKMREGEIDSTIHQEFGNADNQNFSMSVTVCRRPSAQDFLLDTELWGGIGFGGCLGDLI